VAKKLALSNVALANEEGLRESADRLMELADASGLDLADEVGWELLADQCEERGEDEAVVRLALVMAWRMLLQRLHGLLETERGVMPLVGRLKQASASRSMVRQLEELRKEVTARLGHRSGWYEVTPLLMRSALATVERAQKLHDRLKARGLLRES
jgi:hypothetical protein